MMLAPHSARIRRDAQNERDGAGLRCSVAAATPSQQRCAQHQLRRSSISSVTDATRRMSATELVCAALSQQRLRRSSAARAMSAGAPPVGAPSHHHGTPSS